MNEEQEPESPYDPFKTLFFILSAFFLGALLSPFLAGCGVEVDVAKLKVAPIEVRHGVSVDVQGLEEFLRERCRVRVAPEDVETCVEEDIEELVRLLLEDEK